ncbi:hypothetical protein M902_1244 [Bacteriovorax sp. BAL6_X]|nr:hypothetical protein [Bacteriovorax sp. BAL6_X]EPZ50895.1 hypothetical protein M902_1244 [Bacteriovorax sp. BAL6_X]
MKEMVIMKIKEVINLISEEELIENKELSRQVKFLRKYFGDWKGDRT